MGGGEPLLERVAEFLRGAIAVPRPAVALLAIAFVAMVVFGWGTWRQLRPMRELAGLQERSVAALRAETDALRSSADAAHKRVQALERLRSGGARVLMLPHITRSVAPDGAPSVPAQAATQVIQAEIDLAGDGSSTDQRFDVTVRNVQTKQVVWEFEARRHEFWSPDDGLATFLVPGELLPPGDYQFDLRSHDGGGAGRTWPFRVTPLAGEERRRR